MALRIRKDGRILCAAMHAAEAGDTYIDDGLHYEMSVIHKVIASEPMESHKDSGQWWWIGNIPEGVVVSEFYLSNDKLIDRRPSGNDQRVVRPLRGLEKLCKLYGRMKCGDVMMAWDYANECAVPEKELRADKARWAASEKAKWSNAVRTPNQ